MSSMHWPVMCKSKSEDDFDGLWTNHQSKGLLENKARALGEPFGYETNFVSGNGAIRIAFDPKKSLAPHYVFIFGRGNKGQSSISNEGIKLITNSFSPVSMLHSFTDIGSLKIFSQRMLGHIEYSIGLKDVVLRSCDHGMDSSGICGFWNRVSRRRNM